MKKLAKRVLPASLLERYRNLLRKGNEKKLLQSMPASARELYRRSSMVDYSGVSLPEKDEILRTEVMAAAVSIYGSEWNHYSDALRPEVALGFVQTIENLRGEDISYLEIGSCRGLSMAFIGLLLRRRGQLRNLVSVDPYFAAGYDEGALGPYETGLHISIDQTIKSDAFRLYEALNLNVELIEQTSEVALKELLRKQEMFNLIYIDGYHEQLVPTIDFGLSYSLLAKPGIIILDDHLWPDVLPIKLLCDKHAEVVQETWKTASYRFA